MWFWMRILAWTALAATSKTFSDIFGEVNGVSQVNIRKWF
jgi:hypothetical protein